MKTIFFLVTSALTAAGATVVLTGTPVPHPTSFSIPLPQKSAPVEIPQNSDAPAFPVKLNLIDLQETGLHKIVDAPPVLNPTSIIPQNLTHGTTTDTSNKIPIPQTTSPAEVVDLDSLWTNTSLQNLLQKSAQSAESGIQLTQSLPPTTKNDLVKVEPETSAPAMIAAEPVKTFTSSITENAPPANNLTAAKPVAPIPESLQKMVNDTVSTIPAEPVKTQPELVQKIEPLPNLLDKTKEKLVAAKDSLANRFDSLVTELTSKNPLKNNQQAKQQNNQLVKQQGSAKTNALASIPNVELNKKVDEAPELNTGKTPAAEKIAEVKSSNTTPPVEQPQQKNNPPQTKSPPVQMTGSPKKIAYVTWKKGFLSTDKRQLEYQYSGKGKTPVIITGSMSGRDYRNAPLMDRILYRLTENQQLDSMAKYLLVRSPNPDGLAYGLPGNIRGVDLTKNFYLPQNQIVGLKSDKTSPTMADDKLEIETRIFMHLLREYKPELVVQVRLHPEKTTPMVEYPTRLQSRITPYLERNSIKGMEIVQPVPGSIEYYIKTVSGADYLTIYIPDHGNVDQDWLNNRVWFTELLNLCVAQEEIKNELVAAEPIKSGPQAQDEMVSYGSVTPLSPPDPSKLQGEVEFLPPPPGKAAIVKTSPVEDGYFELPPPPHKQK